jgi:hypothetical protein
MTSGAHARSPWLEQARELAAADVASRLGLEVRHAPSSTHWPCCACGATTRHPSHGNERRGAVGSSNENRNGWHCFECEIGGDAIDLVAYALRGARFRDLTVEARAEVRAWFERELGTVDMGARAPRPPRAAPPVAPPKYPPQAEVLALWEASDRVDVHAEVRDYLRTRGIDAGRVADLGLARDCGGVSRPAWARFSRPYRILVPVFDAHGDMRSVLVRSIDSSSDPKSLAPSGGYRRVRLVMACPLARQILETGQRPTWWASTELRIVIAEGEPDFFAAATQWSDAAEHAPATLGIVSGSWSREIAARIPDGATLVIATDDNTAGHKYAATIVESFAGRAVALERWLASDATKRAV